MKVAIVGPIATEDIAHLLSGNETDLPRGYTGAPLMATLIDSLISRGHEVSGFTTSGGLRVERDRWVMAEGRQFRIYYCGARARAFRPEHGRFGRAADFFAIERACLRSAILAESPAVVHAHWSYEFGLAALETGLPCVVTCHDAPQVVLRFMPNPYRFARYLMARRCLAAANVVTAVSPFLRIEAQSYSRVPLEVVPNALPDDVIARAKRVRKGASTVKPIIAMVINGWGRLKNPVPALRGFGLLRRLVPDAELHMFGADFGPGEKAEQWARKHRLHEGTTFWGGTPHDVLLTKLGAADVLVHPSLLEACPMSVIEAMAHGVPVVAGGFSGGVPWVVGEGGLLVDVRKPAAICDALYQLLKSQDVYGRCASAGLSRVADTFSAKSVASAYETQYRRALELAETRR